MKTQKKLLYLLLVLFATIISLSYMLMPHYELILFNISLRKISYLSLIIFFLTGTVILLIRIHEKYHNKNNKELKYTIVSVVGLLACLTVYGVICFTYNDVKFTELKISEGYYVDTVVVKEYTTIAGTTGYFYIKKNSILGTTISSECFHAENGYYPISSDDYYAKYDEKNNQLIILFGANSGKQYPYIHVNLPK